MSFNHTHHTYPLPSPTPGTSQAWFVPPIDLDLDADVDPAHSHAPDFAVFPVASIPRHIRLPLNNRAMASQRVIIVDAQSQLAIHAVRGFLKHAHASPLDDDSDAIDVYAMVQDADAPEAREIKALGATLLQYDPTSGDSIRSALGQSGASTLLLIPPQVDDTVVRTSAILTEARHSIKTILMWSTLGTDDATDLPPEDDIDPRLGVSGDPAKPHVPSALLLLKEAEELVRHVEGMDFVVLRAGFPLQHFFLLSALIQNRGSIPFTSDTAHMAPISLSDMGHATAALLHLSRGGSLPDDYKNKIFSLTGPEPLSGPMIVTAANERLPHPLTFAKVGISDMRSFLLQTRASRFELSLAMGWWRLFMDGKLAMATGDLADLLGGPDRVTKIREFFERHVDRFLPALDCGGAGSAFVHDTYDEWDVMRRASESPSAESSPSKLVGMVVRDIHQHRASPTRRRRVRQTIAAKCIADTAQTSHPNPHRTKSIKSRASMATKVLSETRRSHSPDPAPVSHLALRMSRIVADFHAGLADVLHTTTLELHALQAEMLLGTRRDEAALEIKILIDRLVFMKDLVEACARDSGLSAVDRDVASTTMGMSNAAKVLCDVQAGQVAHARPERCPTNLPARAIPKLVKKVVGDTMRGTVPVEEWEEQEEEGVKSKVGVFAKVMHDVADVKDEVDKQQQQGSCIVQ